MAILVLGESTPWRDLFLSFSMSFQDPESVIWYDEEFYVQLQAEVITDFEPR